MIKVIIPASGIGTRFGSDTPKQFVALKGEPILKRTISAFQHLAIVDEIVVAVPQGYVQTVIGYGFDKVRHVVEGGKDRASSVYAALKCLPIDTHIVLIHDGVRPFVTCALVQTVVKTVKQHGAAVACTPVTDTIKQSKKAAPPLSKGSVAGIHSLRNGGVWGSAPLEPNHQIEATLDRTRLWRAQTPQGFTYNIIMKAYRQAEKDGILHQATDDSALVERLGIPVYIVPSSPRNIKITTAEDLMIAEAFLNGDRETK